MYTPIGISMEDLKNNRMLLLTESDVLSFTRETSDYNRIPGEELLELNIPDSHKRMMSAIQELTYNPEDNSFGMQQNWDFNLALTKNGEVKIWKDDLLAAQIIVKADLCDFLMESIDIYSKSTPNFNKLAFQRDADNLILLNENHHKLIKLDKLKTIRNLNENTYVVIEPTQSKPKVIAGTGITSSKLFESFVSLNENCNTILNKKLVGLFESQLITEQQFTQDKFENIQNLQEEQNELNKSISEVNSLLEVAEENSPAQEKLNESKKLLVDKLDLNIINLNNYKNNHKLYV